MDERLESRSVKELTTALGQDVTLLARQEVELAKAEFSEKMDSLKKDVAAMSTGAALALAGTVIVLMGVVFALGALGIVLWLSALIVGGLAIIGGLVGLRQGGRKVAETDPVPREVQHSLKRDFQATKEAIQ